MTFLSKNQTIMILTGLPSVGRKGVINRFFEQTDFFGTEFFSAESWLEAWNCDLDNVEAVYRIDLSMQSAPENVSEEIATAWLDLNPYAAPTELPPIVENSNAARPSHLALDRDGAADLENDLQREREVA